MLQCASLNRASSANIRSARLPLERYVSLKTCKVLTVLHVFEIMLKYRESGSWAEAIASSIPERKIAVPEEAK
jgi:tRNA (guanine9-N1)-methyltransferase